MEGHLFLLFLMLSSSVLTQSSDHPVYCTGPILNAVQTLNIFKDSKEFVDMPMKFTMDVILQNWKLQVSDPLNKDQVSKFVTDNFLAAGSDIEQVIPLDWSSTPPFLDQVTDPLLKQWGSDVNDIWKQLSKNFTMAESQSSLLQCPFPFIIAGGRFREFYYWDSLWITEGLLLSGMSDSALNMLRNFVHFIEKYGYVPNGARVYYLGRSQPPIASQMADLIIQDLRKKGQFQQAYKLVKEIFPSLEKEHKFWLDNRSLLASDLFSDPSLVNVTLFHYDGQKTPRPEAYREDLNLTKGHEDAENIYKNIWAACESGQDFSSRWFKNETDMSTIRASDIIPVDLNVFITQSEQVLSKFASFLELTDKAKLYETYSSDRIKLINDKLYNDDLEQWNDYIISEKKLSNTYYPSNFLPLLILPKDSDLYVEVRVQIKELIQYYPGGIPQSFSETNQQWDLPNSWAPFNDMIIKGLAINDDFNLSLQVAQNWIDNNYCSFVNSKASSGVGQMFEKYDSQTIGKSGGGGEYGVQTGFGWTNGVAITLLSKYGKYLRALEKC